MQKQNIIFLDIDGVLNGEQGRVVPDVREALIVTWKACLRESGLYETNRQLALFPLPVEETAEQLALLEADKVALLANS